MTEKEEHWPRDTAHSSFTCQLGRARLLRACLHSELPLPSGLTFGVLTPRGQQVVSAHHQPENQETWILVWAGNVSLSFLGPPVEQEGWSRRHRVLRFLTSPKSAAMGHKAFSGYGPNTQEFRSWVFVLCCHQVAKLRRKTPF